MNKNELLGRIANYLQLGGLFNPEAMEHDKVRELIIDCGTFLKDLKLARTAPKSTEAHSKKCREIVVSLREKGLLNNGASDPVFQILLKSLGKSTEAEGDKERLDWLENNWREFLEFTKQIKGLEDLRQAIDAAIANEKGEK